MEVDDRFATNPELIGPGLRTFFRICDRWELTNEQARALLGDPDQGKFDVWKHGQSDEASDEMLIRISHVLGIYKALHLIFPNSDQADGWIQRPSSAPMFEGKPALNLMLESMQDLGAVHAYLRAHEQWA